MLPAEGMEGYVFARVFSDSSDSPLYFAQTEMRATASPGDLIAPPLTIDFTSPANPDSNPRTPAIINGGDTIVLDGLFVDTPVDPSITPVPSPPPAPVPVPEPEPEDEVEIFVWEVVNRNGLVHGFERQSNRLPGVRVEVRVDGASDASVLATDSNGLIRVAVEEFVEARLVRDSLPAGLTELATSEEIRVRVGGIANFGVYAVFETTPDPDPDPDPDPEPNPDPDPGSDPGGVILPP